MSYGFGWVDELAMRVHRNAVDKGFWEDGPADTPRGRLSLLMLVTTEVAEAAEAVRKGDDENFAEELADIVIRVMDIAIGCGVELEQAIVDKMEINAGRKHKHGKVC